MHKLSLKSYLPFSLLKGWASGMALIFCLTFGIFGRFGAAAGATQTKQHRQGQRQHKLTVTVRDPRCPACLKTLRTYLLALNGVQDVSVHYVEKKREKVEISIRMVSSLTNSRVISRIK